MSGVCIGSDGGPYCCLTDKDGSACGEAHPCRIHRPQPAPCSGCAAARELLEALANATIERLSNGWEMLDGDSNRAVSAAELARRAAKEARRG